MPLFTRRDRTDPTPARQSEPLAAFLDRVDSDYFGRVRHVLDAWFDRLAEDVQPDLRARLCSSDNNEFLAAFWEVYLHEVLAKAGFRLTPHPPVPGFTTKPDYLVCSEDGAFYLEATVTRPSAADMLAERREDMVHDLLQQMHSPDFFLDVDVDQRGSDSPPVRSLRRQVERWLATLDADSIIAATTGNDQSTLPTRQFTCGAWRFTLRALPKKPATRGDIQHRPVGMWGSGHAVWLNQRDPLLDALYRKASRYGALSHPYIIAVLDVRKYPPDQSALEDALYHPLPSGLHPAPQLPKNVDGFWAGRRGPRTGEVSAVLTAWNLRPWDVCRNTPLLWCNPTPQRPLPVQFPWRAGRYESPHHPQRQLDSPDAIQTLLGLAPDWPGPGRPFEKE